jgi:hypothetical protein
MTDAQTFAQPPRFVDVKSKRADSQTMCGRATAAKPSPALPSSRQTRTERVAVSQSHARCAR